MDRKRALWISALLYFATFFVGIVVAVIIGTDLSGETPITTMHWILSMVLSVILAALFSLWYFRKEGIKVSVKEGLHLGLSFLVVGIVFDMLILIPYLASGVGDGASLVGYYKDPLFWVSVVLIVLTPGVVGKVKGRE